MNAANGGDWCDVQWVPRLHLVGTPSGVLAHVETGSYPVMVVQAGSVFWLIAASLVLCHLDDEFGGFAWVHAREACGNVGKVDANVVEFGSLAEVRSFVFGIRAGAQGIALFR